MGWGHPCRMRHVTSGRYLAATADGQVVTFHRSAATEDATAFIVRQSKVCHLAFIFIAILIMLVLINQFVLSDSFVLRYGCVIKM